MASARLAHPALVLLLLLPAACEQLPRPFQPDRKPAVALAPGPRSALIVGPIEGGPPDTAAALGELLAKHLRDREIAASTRAGNRRRYRLTGRLAARPAPGGRLSLAAHWRLLDPAGAVVGTVVQRDVVDAAGWAAARPSTLADIAAVAAAKIDRLLAGEQTTTAAATAATLALQLVVVLPVDGAPGDGRDALAWALRQSLAGRGVALADQGTDGAYLVQGDVRLTDRGRHQQTVAITWTVIRPDGRTLGRVALVNAVPRGRLDRRWDEIAHLAAEGGADGLVELLRGARPKAGAATQ